MSDYEKPGQPTKFKKEFCEQVYRLCLLGLNDLELANYFNVCEATLNNWKNTHPQFLESLKLGKIDADSKVARSLYKKAKGHTVITRKTITYDDRVEITESATHIPADTTAQIFWLSNRQPKHWKRRKEVEEKTDESSLDQGEDEIKLTIIRPNELD